MSGYILKVGGAIMGAIILRAATLFALLSYSVDDKMLKKEKGVQKGIIQISATV